jgi:hypothetical protein
LSMEVPIDISIAKINSVLKEKLPWLEEELVGELPNSYGKCSEDAPTPCIGDSDLYYEHKAWLYEAEMYWISGIKTLELDSAVASSISGGLSLSIKGLIKELPAKIRIAECLTFNDCVDLWDNTDGCCGSDKHFEVKVTATCGSVSDPNPLTGFSVDSVSLDSIEITEKIIGITVDVASITDEVKDQVSSVLKEYLTTKKIITLNGSKVTLVDYLNNYETTRLATAVYCASHQGDVVV